MRKKYPRTILQWLGVLAVLAIVVFIVFYKPARGGTRSFIIQVSSQIVLPLHRLGNTWGQWGVNLRERAAAFRDNRTLRDRESQLLIDKAELLKLREENETLRRALSLQLSTKQAVEYGSIIGSFTELRDEYLVIDRGSTHGLREGFPALSPEGVLVGIVRTVSESTATIRLLSSPSETLTISILPAKIDAVLHGDNGGEYTVSLVPESVSVGMGDVVVTAGFNEGIPAGLPVGAVVAVSHNTTESFQDIRVKSPVRFAFLDHVLVVLGER
ncbi:MAG: rod shape-determining protein MreC [Candidatus Sungbacteria bacterium]|uniref:Cell shape-determining protein MreC n=1 Tax=Candidatus Sungiibacteriota bacterium TaxID=2750080 RepID=A0A931SC22_9BACT|nr:rod shape-determining protein MreC [Candidatus Sungbacteria bacterium]